MSLRFGFGILVGIDTYVIPGGELGLSFGKRPLTVDLNSRYFNDTLIQDSDEDQDPKFVSFSMAIGGRYHFLNKRNISPYLGGGLTWGYTQYVEVERELREACLDWDVDVFFFIPYPVCRRWGDKWFDVLYTYKGRGLGAYGIIGIEFGHLDQNPFSLELRIDNPFYELDSLSNQRSVSLGIPILLGVSWLYQF